MLMILPLVLATSAVAPSLTGVWDLKAEDQTIFQLDISETATGITATWVRPTHFQMDNESFSRVVGPPVRRQAKVARLVNGDIELSFDDPAPHAMPDRFRVHRVSTGHVDVTYDGTPFEPYDFTRSPADPAPLGPWDGDRTYVRTIPRPTNLEMRAIFDADQADRQAPDIDWSVVEPADKSRRARTQELLDSGALRSGEDFFNAAFVFQHGSAADDFLKAHLLATVAIARGKPGATWIASATLDRYLQAIGKPQVLGTQFMSPRNGPVTQEPYDRGVASDALRKALQVPTLAEQKEQALRYQKQAEAASKPSN